MYVSAGNHLECLPAGLNTMRCLAYLSLGLNYYKHWWAGQRACCAWLFLCLVCLLGIGQAASSVFSTTGL